MGIPSRHQEHEEEEEYDDALFYEDIQAPKFVDLTAPDAGRPTDDASWFCLRVGCDQNHEQVDPDALDRSFFMRVMAARSPNVRLHKAIRRKNQSSMLKYPHSAPPKPPKARFARLSAGTEAAEKATGPRPKPRIQRICTLQASPPRTKVEPSNARKKALTTTRSKTVRPRQDPCLSVKHQKQPVAATEKKGTVVKALFMNTPKKETARTPVPAKTKEAVSEVCSRLRKLNLACREVPSRYMLNSKTAKKIEETALSRTAKKVEETAIPKTTKKGPESRTNGKKKILGRSVKCADAEAVEKSRNGSDNSAADENSVAETATFHQESNAVLQGVRIVVDTLRADNSGDNKENLIDAEQLDEVPSHYEIEKRVLENNENVPVKVATMQNKLNLEQGGKLKTTNPKPFRLRTDQRRVLKDANPERKLFAENNSITVFKPMNKRPTAKGREKPICSEKQKKQTTQIAMAQLGEANQKQALNGIPCRSTKPFASAMTKGKVVEKSQRVYRVPSTTRTDKAASGLTAPHTRKDRKPSVKTSRLQAAAV